MEQSIPGFKLSASNQMLADKASCKRGIITASAHIEGTPVNYKIGTFVNGIEAYQVICFASASAVPGITSDIDAMLSSFTSAR